MLECYLGSKENDALGLLLQLIFSLERYEAVMEAYISGLEQYDGDLSKVASVASFFISRVDVEVRNACSSSLHLHRQS